MAEGDPRPAHEASHGLRWLAGEKLDVIEPGPAAPVQVFGKLLGQRHWYWEALPDRAARRCPRNLVLGQDRAHQGIGVQGIDQLDLGGSSLRYCTAGPDGKPVVVSTAQDRLKGGAELAADVLRR